LSWFERALSLTHVTDLKDTVSAVAIHHNIGYVLCRKGKGRCSLALEHFQKALLLVNQLGMSDTHLATCLNGIAVLYFHESPVNTEKAMEMFK
jgi:hypothetical protein